MILALARRLQNLSDPQSFFYSAEAVIAGVFLLIIWLLRPKSPESNFQVREEDLRRAKMKKPNPLRKGPDLLAEARIKRQEPVRPLQLGGIRIDGLPHEILGISAQASATQIQQAYRELMKRYHPDKVGTQGSREWQDAQKIAEAINRAKVEMLKNTKS